MRVIATAWVRVLRVYRPHWSERSYRLIKCCIVVLAVALLGHAWAVESAILCRRSQEPGCEEPGEVGGALQCSKLDWHAHGYINVIMFSGNTYRCAERADPVGQP